MTSLRQCALKLRVTKVEFLAGKSYMKAIKAPYVIKALFKLWSVETMCLCRLGRIPIEILVALTTCRCEWVKIVADLRNAEGIL